jgi:shikimate kinase
MTESTRPEINLYLVGFMGTGKTTIGRAVANRLNYQLLDSDHEIEREDDMTVAEIFDQKGEAYFREREREFIDQGHPSRGAVVACGGGLVVQDGMLAKLHAKGVVVCLHASLETILERTSANRNRPLLHVEDPMARLRALYEAREPIYRRAGAVILTDHRPSSDIVSHVLRVYRRESAEWGKSATKPRRRS